MKLTIGHLYPELLNLYGDRGNIICMVQRLKWRGIDAEVKEFDLNDKIDFSKLDIVLLGGGSDREQLLVCNRLKRIKKDFIDYVEQGGVVLAICGGYQLLGNFHSHPESPSRPSEEDKRLAYDSKVNYLILSLMDLENPVLNAFVIDEEKNVSKEELIIS